MQLKKIYHYFSFVNGKSMVRKHQRFYLLGQIHSQSSIWECLYISFQIGFESYYQQIVYIQYVYYRNRKSESWLVKHGKHEIVINFHSRNRKLAFLLYCSTCKHTTPKYGTWHIEYLKLKKFEKTAEAGKSLWLSSHPASLKQVINFHVRRPFPTHGRKESILILEDKGTLS